MIITQTPVRISFAGGGTDFREFFLEEGGCVVSTAIDKYLYVIMKERYNAQIRVAYTKAEAVDHPDQIEHELVREALKVVGIYKGIEVITTADIPSEGSGLGSSSSLTVGLLNAAYAYAGEAKGAGELAREACAIEIDILKKPIGEQDQYIAAYGGFRMIEFGPQHETRVRPLALEEGVRQALQEDLMLFSTGRVRSANPILAEQRRNIGRNAGALREMRAMACGMAAALTRGQLGEFAALLRAGWRLKKTLSGRISSDEIDGAYEAACRAGALGGKIAGAGGGGHLVLYCPRARQEAVRSALAPMLQIPFQFEPGGSRVIVNYNGKR